MSSCHTNHIQHHSHWSSLAVLRSHMESPWPTRRGDQWPRNTILYWISPNLWVSRDLSSSFHSLSPTDRWTDQKVNQEVEQFLWLFVSQCQDNLYEWLSITEFTYNDWVHTSMHSSPFMMDTRQNPQLGIEPLRESCLETLNDFASRMEAATKEAYSALTKEPDEYDLLLWCPSEGSTFIHGWRQSLAQWAEHHYDFSNEEIDHKWLCPYPVDKVISWSTYQLKLPSSFSQTHPVFSVTRCNTTMWTHCRASSTQPSTPSHSCWSQRIWSGTYLDSWAFQGKLKYLM